MASASQLEVNSPPQTSDLASLFVVGEQRKLRLPPFESVRRVLGSAPYDQTTQAAIDYLLHHSSEAWHHLLRILARSTRGKHGQALFLPWAELKIEPPTHDDDEDGDDGSSALPDGPPSQRRRLLEFEGSKSRTDQWREDWLRTRLTPWRNKTRSEILAASDDGEFRYLGHECCCDLINEIQRLQKQPREVNVEEIDLSNFAGGQQNKFDLHSDVVRKDFNAAEFLPLATREHVGDLAVGLRSRLASYPFIVGGVDEDIFDAVVLAEIARELKASPERAKEYDKWFRSHVRLALENNPVLQAVRAALFQPEPVEPVRPAVSKRVAEADQDWGDFLCSVAQGGSAR